MSPRNLAAVLVTLVLVACADNTGEEDQPVIERPGAEPATAPAANPVMLDPNTASTEELAEIPGMNPTLADALVDGRPYQDMRAVNQVLAALTDEQRDTIYTRMWKPLDLNSASAEEIELIPGVGPRMRHEFEEYRPYTSMEQFRQEIGKYVDKHEVARLERYVAIRTPAQ